MECVAQKWVQKGNEGCALLVQRSESPSKNSFVTQSEFKIVMNWVFAFLSPNKPSVAPLEMGNTDNKQIQKYNL